MKTKFAAIDTVIWIAGWCLQPQLATSAYHLMSLLYPRAIHPGSPHNEEYVLLGARTRALESVELVVGGS